MFALNRDLLLPFDRSNSISEISEGRLVIRGIKRWRESFTNFLAINIIITLNRRGRIRFQNAELADSNFQRERMIKLSTVKNRDIDKRIDPKSANLRAGQTARCGISNLLL